jgi:hypothetical protein
MKIFFVTENFQHPLYAGANGRTATVGHGADRDVIEDNFAESLRRDWSEFPTPALVAYECRPPMRSHLWVATARRHADHG